MVILAVVAGLLVALLVLPSGRWDLLPSMAVSALSNGPGSRLKPAPAVRTAPAVNVQPAPGLRLEAPANAVDKPRQFQASELSREDLTRVAEDIGADGALTLGGWRLDAAMTDEDLFPGEVTASVDLKHLRIPDGMREFATLVHVADDGTMTPLAGDLRNGRLCAGIRHNGWLVVRLVIFWAPVAAYAGHYAWTEDRADVPKGNFVALPWQPGDTRFILYWPEAWPGRNPNALKQLKGLALAALIRNPPPGEGLEARVFRLPPASSWSEFNEALFNTFLAATRQGWDYRDWIQKLDADGDYVEFRRRVSDAEWLRDNILPVKVGHAVRALDRAADYLEERNFRKPGVARQSMPVNTYVVDQGGAKFGESCNTWTTSPYMVINASNISPLDAFYFLDGAPAPLKTAANPPNDDKRRMFKGQFDDMQLTILHELFHIVQGAYNLYASPDYTWFDEATAVTLENEGFRDYKKRGWVTTTSDLTTDRELDFVFYELDRKAKWSFADYYGGAGPTDADAGVIRKHGYGASFFVEYLRDHYYKTQPDLFLPALLEDFARFRGGTIASLYRVTSNVEETLAADYEMFVLDHLEDIWALAAKQPPGSPGYLRDVQLGRLKTYEFCLFRPHRPLSVQFCRVRTPRAITPLKPEDRPVYAVAMNGLGELGVSLWRHPDPSGRGKQLPEGGGVLPPEAAHRFMRVQKYLKVPDELARTSDAGIDGQGPVIFGMERDGPPDVQLDGDTIRVAWEESPHARLRNSGNKRIAVAGYRLQLHLPDRKTLNFAPNEPRAELPVKLVRDLLMKQRKDFVSKMWYAVAGWKTGRNDIGPLVEITEAFAATEAWKIGFSYCEVAAATGRPRGPFSEVAVFELDDEAATAFGISGQWRGRVPFSEGMLMDLDINESSSGFEGTMHFGGEEIPIRGKLQPTLKAWSIQMRNEKVWLPAWTAVQKLPGDRLYLYAPPCLLKHTTRGSVRLGWRHEPGEMDWTQFLQLLAAEIRAMEQQNKASQEQ